MLGLDLGLDMNSKRGEARIEYVTGQWTTKQKSTSVP